MLKDQLGFRPEDPLFPSTAVALNAIGEFQAQGLARDIWSTAQPIRRIFGDAFTARRPQLDFGSNSCELAGPCVAERLRASDGRAEIVRRLEMLVAAA